jgi:hypothetical protein
MLPHGVEATFLLLKRRDEILNEEVCAGGERYRVLDRGLELVAIGLDGGEGLVYGCGRDRVKERN